VEHLEDRRGRGFAVGGGGTTVKGIGTGLEAVHLDPGRRQLAQQRSHAAALAEERAGRARTDP